MGPRYRPWEGLKSGNGEPRQPFSYVYFLSLSLWGYTNVPCVILLFLCSWEDICATPPTFQNVYVLLDQVRRLPSTCPIPRFLRNWPTWVRGLPLVQSAVVRGIGVPNDQHDPCPSSVHGCKCRWVLRECTSWAYAVRIFLRTSSNRSSNMKTGVLNTKDYPVHFLPGYLATAGSWQTTNKWPWTAHSLINIMVCLGLTESRGLWHPRSSGDSSRKQLVHKTVKNFFLFLFSLQ